MRELGRDGHMSDQNGGRPTYEIEVEHASGMKEKYEVEGWDFALPNWVVLVTGDEVIYLPRERISMVRTPVIRGEGGGVT